MGVVRVGGILDFVSRIWDLGKQLLEGVQNTLQVPWLKAVLVTLRLAGTLALPDFNNATYESEETSFGSFDFAN